MPIMTRNNAPIVRFPATALSDHDAQTLVYSPFNTVNNQTRIHGDSDRDMNETIDYHFTIDNSY